jgi:hypothetical protein
MTKEDSICALYILLLKLKLKSKLFKDDLPAPHSYDYIAIGHNLQKQVSEYIKRVERRD